MSSSASELVSTTTGMRRSSRSLSISFRTSVPSFRGRLRSSNTRSGCGLSAYSPSRSRNFIASTPSPTTWRLFSTSPRSSASSVSRTSPGLSSTSRISIGSPANPSVIRDTSHGEREVEGRTLTDRRLDPHVALVAVDYLLAHRQSDAGARVLVFAVESPEDAEHFLALVLGNPDAVVADREDVLVAVSLGGDVDAGRPLVAVLEGVADEVLEQHHHLALVADHGRERVAGNLCLALGDGDL